MGARTRTGWHPCRLLPLLPGDGESLSSLLDRQAQCWGTTRRQMMLQVSPLQCMSAGDVDLMEAEGFLGDYAAACGLPVEALASHRAERKDHLLPQHLRIAYCPICFAERLEQGQAPYFRLDWARRLLTHCLIHRCPLFPWGSSNSEGRRRMPANWLDGNPARPVYVRNFREHLAKARDFAPGALPKWRCIARRMLSRQLETSPRMRTASSFAWPRTQATKRITERLEGSDRQGPESTLQVGSFLPIV